jgi:NCS1 family nucleobase:cation symporter-1
MGNFLGLPVNFVVFAIVTVIVTAGTVQVFGEAIMDPVLIVERIGNPVVVAIGSITFIVATMGINIVANFVSPAYDIANLYPKKINFRLGGLITSILSVLVCPWLFVASPQAITVFVAIFGAVLGPLFGTIIADYYLVKRQTVVLDDLYSMSPAGSYFYDNGWNYRAVVALAASKGPPSSLVQLRNAVWTGDTRDTRPISDIAAPFCCDAHYSSRSALC